MKFSYKNLFHSLIMLAVVLAGISSNSARAAQMAAPPTWNEIGPIPLNGNVTSIAVNGTDIYVAGNFTDAGGVTAADYIAKWNGTAWSALGPSDNGLNGTISDMATLGSDLYIVGTFTSVNGVEAKGVAKWNGTVWSAVGSGIGGGEVHSIVVSGSDIYVAGFFSFMGGVPAHGVAKWDGAAWSGLGSGVNFHAYDITVNGTDIYVAGDFTDAGGNSSADYIARWDGVNWLPVGQPLAGTYFNIAILGTDIYASGFITGDSAAKIVKWDGVSWGAISPQLETPDTFTPFVYDFLVSGSDLIVAGHFINAGGNASVDYLAKWNGTTWSAFDATPLNGDVNAIAVSGNNLYVGGAFTDAGGNTTADHLARYGVPPTFTDVPTYYWAWNYIERLASAGITGGCGDGTTYCPTNSVTRAQMSIFLLKGIHGAGYTPPGAGISTGFTDVPSDYWAAAWIKQLATEAITSGCGNGNYCPEDSVTRAQMAVFLLKAKYGSSYAPPNVTATFSDTGGHWAEDWIEQLAAEGITSGCSSGNYCPENPVTRDQMAVFLVKTFNLP